MNNREMFPGKTPSPIRAIVKIGDDEFEAYVLDVDHEVSSIEYCTTTLRVRSTGSLIMSNFYSYTAKTLLERMLIRARKRGEEKSIDEIMCAMCMLDL